MRLEELYLDGFGHFHQRTIGPIPAPVTVFYGPNEAGKSTLLAFIRAILFDFPRQYSRHYPPLSGGRHGGRIKLSDSSGTIYTVERFTGPRGGLSIAAHNGPVSNPNAALQRLTGNATADLFRNVFAFSLDELQAAASLNESNSAIYSAGQGAPGLPALQRSLAEQKREIYLPRGNNQEIPRLLNALREVENQLRAIDGSAARYGQLTARKTQVDAELADNAQLSRLSARRAQIANLQAGWELWIELSDCETRLQQLPRFPNFPDNPIPRLEGIEQQLQQAREAREEVAAQLCQSEAEAAAEIPGEALLPDKDRIESIRRARGSFDNSVSDLPERQAELHGMQANFAKNLADLGHPWSEAQLQAFDTSLVIRDQASQWKQQADETAARLRQAQSQVAQERRDLQDRQAETQEAQEKLPPDPPPMDAPTLAQRQDALRSARGMLAEYERHRQNHETLRGQLNALAASRETAANPQRRRFNPALLALLGAAALLMALTAPAGGYFILGIAGALIMGILGAAVLLTAAAILWPMAKPAPNAAPSLMDSTLARQTADAESAAESARQSLLAATATLDLDGPPDSAALDSAEAKLESARNALDAWTAANALADDATRRQERQQQRIDAALAEQEAADAVAQETQQQWRQWLAERNLNQSLTPDAMTLFLSQIQTARASLSEADGMRRRIAAIQDDIQQFRQQVAPLAARHAIDLPPDDNAQLASAADSLIQRLDQAQARYSQREQAANQAQEIRRLLQTRQQRVQSVEQERNELLAAADTDDPEEFRRRARQRQERQELERQRDELRRSLEQISGPGDRFDAFRHSLSNADPNALQEELAQLQEQYDELETRRNTLREERGAIDNELTQLTGEQESSALRIRQHSLIEQLRERARQWSRLTIAETLLEKTRQKFEQERQPSVIRHAQDFFASITGQRYQRLYAPIGEQTITVTDADNASKQPTELSRGAREQLYLALRFGLIREFGEHAERLPVVVDEALVNFDPQRARLSAQSFAQLSETNQILVFTCHPETADMFAHTADANIININP